MLYIIGTPIGNLEDISNRALRILREVDLILCEDTRRTKKLLLSFEIKTPTESYHHHSKLKKKKAILDLLEQGKDLALVSDAGMPGIADPGGKLIDFLYKQLPDLQVSPIPGCSAITALASVSGFPMNSFLFLGYPPKKNKRKKFFKGVADSEYPVIFFEAPYRILKTLNELQVEAGHREVVVGRELTKKFERVYRGTLDQIIQKLQDEQDEQGDSRLKGEFTVILNKCAKPI